MNKHAFFSRLLLPLFLSAALPVFFPAVSKAEEASLSPPSIDSKISLELQKVDILDVFKILAKKAGMNIVAGKGVQGQVSIFLQDVPVAEALQTILQSQALASVQENGVIKVMTEAEYFQKYGRPYGDERITKTFHLENMPVEKFASKLGELRSPLGKIIPDAYSNAIYVTELPDILREMEDFLRETDQPQEVAVFMLRHAKVEDIEPKLKSFLEGSSGTMETDKRSNRVVVKDIPANIRKIKDVVSALDVQMPQVLITAKIVEVRLNDNYRQGIDWEHIEHELGGFNTLAAAAPLAVSPPAGAAALTTLALGSGTDDTQIVLQLLEQVGKVNLLSSPRLTVLNGEEANLAVATRQPFISQTVVQTTNSTNTADNVQFIDVGVTLKVSPRISRDHFIIIKIQPEISTSSGTVELEGVAEGSNTTFTRTRIPVVTTQELETTVQVQSGTTLVVGGLIQDRQEKESSKIPGLGSIPVIGKLFQSFSNDFEKTELVMFLTPTIIEPDAGTSEEKRYLESGRDLLPFNEVGGYSYHKDWMKSDRFTNFGRIPYWEKKSAEEPLRERDEA